MLTEKAMLVTIEIKNSKFTRTDRHISEEVEEAKHAKRGVGKYTKNLFARGQIGPINKHMAQVRDSLKELTLPWSKGQYLLPSKNFYKFTERVRNAKARTEELKGELRDNLLAYIDDQRENMGSLFNYMLYPSAHDIDTAYGVYVDITPMPDAGDWRLDIENEALEELKLEMQTKADDRLKSAMTAAWERLFIRITTMREKLDLEDLPTKSANSMLNNLIKLVELLPGLNITNDPDLAKLTKEVEEKLLVHDPKALQDSKELRQKVATDAQDVLDKMSLFM